MDVVNGKIVSARTEKSRSDIWRTLKPSSGLLQQEGAGLCPPAAGKPAAVGSVRGYSNSSSCFPVVPGPAAFDQPACGWKQSRNSDQQSRPSWGQRDPHHNWSYHHSLSSEFVVSRAVLDQELDMCESRVSRAIIDRFASTECVGQVRSMTTTTSSVTSATTPDDAPLRPGAPAGNPLNWPHSQNDQVDAPWIAPLRYLLRKVMSVSDVGELGRIVLPKKDAEGQLPSIDTKGKQLEMKDYSLSRSWFFHYKWWVNNKSRMYVLENTGGFIKYHGLEANDIFFVYQDGCGNLVARGQKKLAWNPQLDVLPEQDGRSCEVPSPKLFGTEDEDRGSRTN